MLQEKIVGNKYDYIIELSNFKKEYNFEIKTLFKKDRTKSGIVNLNCIIDELIVPIINIMPIDSSIRIRNKKKAYLIYITSLSLFKEKSWIEYLEKCLDDDRSYGEWKAEFE